MSRVSLVLLERGTFGEFVTSRLGWEEAFEMGGEM
jgi:hypothetical protein